MSKISSNSVALAGEFAVLSQLTLNGYNASMTLGNTKNIDILVSDVKTNKMYRLEVKTNYRHETKKHHESKIFGKTVSSWIMRSKHETLSSPKLFYCFVNIDPHNNQLTFYIVPSKVVAKYIRDEHGLWIKSKHGKCKDIEIRNFRLGTKDGKYSIQTPLAEKYKDNWKFKR